MADMTTIADILEKAKQGQFVPVKCAKRSTDVDAWVVQLGTEKTQGVKTDDWEEGWPSDVVRYDTIACNSTYVKETININNQ